MERLIQILQKAQLGLSEDPLSPLDIADVIWLATQLNQRQSQLTPIGMTSPEDAAFQGNEDLETVLPGDVGDEGANPLPGKSPSSAELEPQAPARKPDILVAPSGGPAAQQRKSLPFRVPAAKAILQRRQISRSLHVLNRKVPSPIEQQLDVVATINRTSEEELCIPVYKPAPQRWLDVALVIEQSDSYGIWSQSINEFHQILVRQGAFRDVKRWYAHSDSKRGLILRSLQGNIRNPKELISPRGDRLILVLSDCVSNAWYEFQAHSVAENEETDSSSQSKESEPMPFSWFDWLSLWRLHHSVTVVQMLPPSFWRRTALRSMDELWLSSNRSGALNHQWQRESTTPWEEHEPSGLPVPIVTFDPHALKVWAKGVAGVSQTQISGISFEAISKPSKVPADEGDLFEHFMEYASPVARRLAALVSVVPIQLPIIRLVQKNLLFHESNAVHVAELFFSGILRPIDNESNPEKRLYDFVGDLRYRLNRTIPEAEAASVIDCVSRDIMRRAGIDSIDEFRACLVAPRAQDSNIDTSEIREFARITLDVLRRLGGEYAAFVETLETNDRDYQESDWPPLIDFDFQPPIISFEDIIVLPPIETQMVEVVTIAVEEPLYQFEFEVVKLVRPYELPIKRPTEETIFFPSDRFDRSPEAGRKPYVNYEALQSSEQEGEDFQIRVREANTSIAVFALHGGKIEPGTSEIADAVAGEELTFYGFEGLKNQGNHLLGIKEVNFDEPRVMELVQTVDHVLEIHGVVSLEAIVFLGGTDQEWIKRLENSLSIAGFEVQQSDRGKLNRQYCNRGKSGQGVYLELSQGLRERLFSSLDSGDSPDSTLFDQFVRAIRSTIPSLSEWIQQRQGHHAEAFSEEVGEGIQLEMVAIPAGTFMMGSSEKDTIASKPSEKPQHEVTVPEFYMGRYPVTQSQWRAVAALPKIERELEANPSHFEGDDLPVETVSWYEVVEFCQRLSQQTGKAYRLPSEAQWEYACRAGTTTAFNFGDMITTDVANYNGGAFNNGTESRGRSQTTPVSEFGIGNAFGLSDMHGNVWEWCEDNYHDNYEDAPKDGSPWIKGGNSDRRILRGGSWINYPVYCRSAYRVSYSPDDHGISIGFRVVCAVRGTP